MRSHNKHHAILLLHARVSSIILLLCNQQAHKKLSYPHFSTAMCTQFLTY